MRIAIVAAAAAFLIASPAFATETPPPAAPANAKPEKAKRDADDPNRVVCTREHVVGSNRPQKICMTVAERQRLKDHTDNALGNGYGGAIRATPDGR